MAPSGRTLLVTSCVFLGTLGGCGSSSSAPTDPTTPDRTASDPKRQAAPPQGHPLPQSTWVIADPPDLRALTLIVQVVPPADIAEAYADLGARHKDLRPLMEAHNEGGFGSGFVIVARETAAVRPYVVTNQHVVGLSTQVALGREGSSLRALGRVVYVDPIYDLAIVEPSSDAIEKFHLESGLGFSARPARDQDVVVASGFPGIEGDPSYQVTRGNVSNERVLFDVDGEQVAHIQHTAPIDPGSSGGPLLDERSRVLGINTLKIRWREGVGLAVPAAVIEGALRSLLERTDPADHRQAAYEACKRLLDSAISRAAWAHTDRLIGAALVGREGVKSLWLLPEGDTDWLTEFVEDPAHVMALAVGFRLQHELGILKAAACDARSSPTDDVQTFTIGSGGMEKSLDFGIEQGTLKLLDYTFSPGTGRSFLDPKKASSKKWKPSL